MSFGKMNVFIDIVQKKVTTDDEGFKVETDEVLASVRAYREGRHGSEKWANMAAFTTATDLFRFRAIPNLTVTTDMKIICSGHTFGMIVWQCNHKFDGGEKCTTPHLDEETVKVLFLKAANAIFGERDSIREDYEAVKERLYDTSELEAERIQLQDEMNIVAEMIQQCVNENARVALDQAEYQKKYDGLADRFDRIKERLEAVGIAITERMAKREKTERFLAELEKRDGPLTEFDEEDWYSLVEYATVYSREDIRFTFKNGMEIKA